MHDLQPKVAKILTRVGGATAIIVGRLVVSKERTQVMNIEIANKLVKLRKKAGLSQEELADKLGLSRQAVSKWERAEASPDTDNLICLAKLYGVSLDELLSTEDDPETIIREQVKKDDEPEPEKKKEHVHISDEGIHIVDDDGESVTINDDGIELVDENGKHVTIGDHDHEYNRKEKTIYWAISGILYVLATVAYILLGILLGMWSSMWILFFVPDIIMSLAEAIERKKPQRFNMVFLSTFTFFLVCLVLFPEQNLWHPMWAVFLAIPVYYIITNRIRYIIRIKKQKDNPNVIDDDDDKDDNGGEDDDD